MELIEAMTETIKQDHSDKTPIAYTPCIGTWFKRVWFEVPNNQASIEEFYTLCKQLDDIIDLHKREPFLKLMKEKFESRGFFRIAI